MKWLLLCSVIVLLECRPAFSQPRAGSDYLNPASLAADLHSLQGGLNEQNATAIANSLPTAWHTRAPDGDYLISSAPLRDLLSQRARVSSAKVWLTNVEVQLEAYSAAAPPPANALAELHSILARAEFAANRPPTAWDRYSARIRDWIEEQFRRLFDLMRQNPTASSSFFWVLTVAAVALISLWAVRLFRGRRPQFTLKGLSPPHLARSSERWLSAAYAAAGEGNARRAIQCSYWAAIGCLQDSGALPRGNTQTPREYLRRLSDSAIDQSLPSNATPALRALTVQLERFWYARAVATADDFSSCLKILEELGCKVD